MPESQSFDARALGLAYAGQYEDEPISLVSTPDMDARTPSPPLEDPPQLALTVHPPSPLRPFPAPSLVPGDQETSYISSQALGLLDPKLSQARRRQLDVINKLHSLGAHLDIDIPQIVVIGSQSAGKSSLIESISGITLPRSSGTCTRCPTECRLIRSETPWECQVSLRFITDEYGRPLPAVKNVPFGSIIRDPRAVEGRIRRAQRAALNPNIDPQLFLDSVGTFVNALDFSTNCISLEIKGPDVTDLSFCDLPGKFFFCLIASVSDDGREEDIERVEQLVSSYISKPSCIILLTVACESDFETQGAYRLAKKHDKTGTRTIGVLTKPDRIAEGETKKWIRLIENQISALEHGWYCVKQPSTKELEEGLTFEEARRRGEDFFNSQPWSLLERQHHKKLGTRALTHKLNEYLMSLIAKRFPELRDELERVLQVTKDELRKLPEPSSQDPLMELMHLIGNFSDDLFRYAEGFHSTPSGLGIGSTSGTTSTPNQFVQIRNAHEWFRELMRATAPNFLPFHPPVPSRPASPIPEPEPIQIWHQRNRSLAPTPVEPAEDESPEPDFLKSEEIVSRQLTSKPMYLLEVIQRVQLATTRELPGYFPFHVIQDLISLSTKQWEDPTQSLVNSIHYSVLEHHMALVNKCFGEYTAGGLRDAVLKIVHDYAQERREKALEKAMWLLELEAHAFTLNEHYLSTYRDKFLKFYKDKRQKHFGPYHHPSEPEPWSPDRYGIEIMATVRAYFQVAYKRVVDNVPLAIDRELVRVKKRHAHEALCKGLNIFGPDATERCRMYLAEPEETIERRKELRIKLERLINAQVELLSV